MRVAIDCRSFLKRQYTGIGRYAYHLVKSLTEIDRNNEFQLYARKRLFDFHKQLPRFQAKNFTPHIDRFNRGPAHTLKDTDIFHFPSPSELKAPHSAKIIVTVHDLIFKAFPEGHTRATIELGCQQFEDIKKKASHIICCSQSTVNDLQKYFQIPKEKISLVDQGVNKNTFYTLEEQERLLAHRVIQEKGIEGPFILSVGTIEPRKNLVNLIYAFSQLKSAKKFSGVLVVAGMKGWMSEDLGALIEKLQLKDDIIFLGYLSNQELCYFYNLAKVFVFPSLYEGFGFPIVEAFCCSVPVVTSNVSSCPEVAGDAALMVDPKNSEEIAQAIDQIISDLSLADLLKQKGLLRAENFSFKKTAMETLRVYNEVYQL